MDLLFQLYNTEKLPVSRLAIEFLVTICTPYSNTSLEILGEHCFHSEISFSERG